MASHAAAMKFTSVTSLFVVLFASTAGLLCACGEVRVANPPDGSPPAAVDAGASLGVHVVKPECDHLVAYIRDWEVDSVPWSVRLQGFVRFINQGQAPVDLSSLRGNLARATDGDIEVTSFVERWVETDGLVVPPGEHAGFLSLSASEVISAMVDLAPNRTYDLVYFEIDRWNLVVDRNLPVSIEFDFQTDRERWDLHVRLTPGDETRAVTGAYACPRRI